MCFELRETEEFLEGIELPDDVEITVKFGTTTDLIFTLWKCGENIGGFSLRSFSNNMGITESHATYIAYNQRGNGYANILQEVKVAFAKRFSTSLIASVSHSNDAQKHILPKYGWKELNISDWTSLWYLDYHYRTPKRA